MGEPIAFLALRRKCDQIFRTIAHYERLLRVAEHDLAHVNAALRLLRRRAKPPAFRYIDLNRVLRRGKTTKICIDALAIEGRWIAVSLPRAGKGLLRNCCQNSTGERRSAAGKTWRHSSRLHGSCGL